MDIFGLHLIRPLWLLALLPIPALMLMLKNRYQQPMEWRGVLNADLQTHLLEPRGSIRLPLSLLIIAWIIAAIAAAGPAWRQSPQPLQRSQEALVLILDLSPSMYATDLAPSRLERARNKLHDILRERREGLTALIVYAGDAFAITPLTDDTETIRNLLDSMSPKLIPKSARGSNPLAAFEEAKTLLADSAAARALLITDGVRSSDVQRLNAWLKEEKVSLSILGVGTRNGAPIPLPNGDFLRDAAGNLIVAGLDAAPLRRLAAASDGRYHALTLDDSDIDYLLGAGGGDDTAESERQLKIWREEGVWLTLALLPLALMGFRRGWLLALTLALGAPAPAQALQWRDLWLRRDQQGAAAYLAGEADKAAELLDDAHWRGLALYKINRYTEALETLPAEGDAVLHYNRGNALAVSGKLQAALNAYDAALELNPSMEDAGHNREIIRQLLEQAEQAEQGESGEGSPDGENQQAQQSDQRQNNQQQQSSAQNSEDSSEGSSAQQDAEEEAAEEQSAASTENGENGEDGEEADAERDLSALLREGSADPESERRQALDTFLRQVPDDHPAQLLRKKLQYQHRERQRERRSRVRREEPGL